MNPTESTIEDMIYSHGERLTGIETQITHLVTQADFEARMAALEATITTSRWWVVAGIAFLSAVIGFVGLLQSRNQDRLAAVVAQAVIAELHAAPENPGTARATPRRSPRQRQQQRQHA